MQRFPQALFLAGGVEVIEGRNFTTKLVRSEDELHDALAEGWHETADEAADAAAKAEQVPEQEGSAPVAATRAELEAEATALGIKFRSNTSDETLAERIAAAKAEQGA